MQASRQAIFATIIVLGASCAWLLFNMGRDLQPIHLTPIATIHQSTPILAWQHAENWAVFGKKIPTTIALSSLPWQIKGIFYAKKPEKSQVILLIDHQEEKIYRVGDPIAQGARIQQIFENAVVISRDGQLERLNLIPIA